MSEPLWQLPAGWRWARFEDVARVASDLVDPADHQTAPHVAPNHIESETGRLLPHRTIGEDQVTSPKHRFRPGQVLYSKIRPYLAKVVVAEFEGLCSADMYPIDSRVDARYLKWWMLTRDFTRLAAGQQARTVLPKINKAALAQLPVPVAPPAEQWQIVEILEDHLSRLDAGEALLRAAEQRRAALAKAALDRLVSSNAHGIKPLSAFVARIEAGKSFAGPGRPASRDEWGIIKVSSMTWGRFKPEENKVVVDESRVDRRYEIRQGDLLISRANTAEYVGASVLVGGTRPRLLLSDKSLRLIPRDDVDPAWLWRVLSSPSARRQISTRATGTKDSMRNISQASLLAVEIPDAPTEVRRNIVDLADDLEVGLELLRADVMDTQARSAALRRALLQAAFSGRLTGRSSDQEFIEELASV